MKKATWAVGKRRLLTLASFLATNPKAQKRFDYGMWASFDWDGKPIEANVCNTKACALGWATAIPSLRRAGLRLAVDVYNEEPCVTILKTRRPHDSYASSINAAMTVFALSEEEAERVFIPDDLSEHRATAKEVAKKIRNFVKQKDQELRDG